MNKSVIYITVICFLFFACGQRQAKKQTSFTDEVRLKTTPVKSQGKSSLCWIYSMLATIETEHLMQGDSVNLSEDYIARMWLNHEARECYLNQGKTSVNMRGTALMTLRLLEKYGAEPYDSYHQKKDVNYHVLCNKLTQISRNASIKRLGFKQLNKDVEALMDEEIDFLPRFVFMAGAEYTPLEFGHSVCRPHEYVALTSFSHHPFGEEFVLEIPDNQLKDKVMNVPIDSLMRRIDTSIRHNHPVCWEGDVTEPMFSHPIGIGKLTPNQSKDLKKTKDKQQLRQQQFERFNTTDDHCMMLMGIAHDAEGNKYYMAKNSWGDNPYGGYMYISEEYLLMKTILVILKNE
ncbi:MAG: cysteine protease [Prevotella sp.]|nr:cysteine protease [Prevotella sp.]MBQ2524113.1 cysteine protease [Prevotella sp.]